MIISFAIVIDQSRRKIKNATCTQHEVEIVESFYDVPLKNELNYSDSVYNVLSNCQFIINILCSPVHKKITFILTSGLMELI